MLSQRLYAVCLLSVGLSVTACGNQPEQQPAAHASSAKAPTTTTPKTMGTPSSITAPEPTVSYADPSSGETDEPGVAPTTTIPPASANGLAGLLKTLNPTQITSILGLLTKSGAGGAGGLSSISGLLGGASGGLLSVLTGALGAGGGALDPTSLLSSNPAAIQKLATSVDPAKLKALLAANPQAAAGLSAAQLKQLNAAVGPSAVAEASGN